MRFFLDENFPKSAANMLRQIGHEVTRGMALGKRRHGQNTGGCPYVKKRLFICADL
jgi:hypothetical protein